MLYCVPHKEVRRGKEEERKKKKFMSAPQRTEKGGECTPISVGGRDSTTHQTNG